MLNVNMTHLPVPPPEFKYRFERLGSGDFVTTGAFRPSAPNRKEESLGWCGCIFADFDMVDYLIADGEKKEDAKKRMYALSPEVREDYFWEYAAEVERRYTNCSIGEPTVVVRSGWGLHCYWWIHDDVATGGIETGGIYVQENLAAFKLLKQANVALTRELGADVVHDTGTRILRAVGSINNKAPNAPIACEILATGSSRISWEQILWLADQGKEKIARKAPAGCDKKVVFPDAVEAIWQQNKKLAKYYANEGRKTGDLTTSGYDFALALELARMGVGARDIAQVLATRENGRTIASQLRSAEKAIDIALESSKSGALVDAKAYAGLRCNDYGAPYLEIDNLITIMKTDPRCSDIVTGTTWSPDLIWKEKAAFFGYTPGDYAKDFVSLYSWIAATYDFVGARLEDLCVKAIRNQACKADPVNAYLGSLVWDGVSRLGSQEMADALGTDGSGLFAPYMRVWFTQAVRRAHEAGCNAKYAMFLYGPQNSGKSGVVKIIGQGFSSDSKLDFKGDLETLRTLRRKWIWEIAETGNASNRTSNQIKSFISGMVDEIRDPYERSAQAWPRRQCFIMTSNHAEFIQDDSGAVRFLPVHVSKVNFDWWKENIDQIWAEAMAFYKSGSGWDFLDDEMIAHTENAAETLSESDAMTDKIESTSWSGADAWKLYDVMSGLGFEQNQISSKMLQRQIASCLRKLRWSETRNAAGKFWVPPKA